MLDMHESTTTPEDSINAAPERVWRANLRQVRPGDVLLTRNVYSDSAYDRTQSSTICKATGGKFSHAMICTQAPTFIEAVGHGVSNLSIQNCFAYNADNVRLLRYTNAEISTSASRAALLFLGRPYSVKRAIASVLPEVGSTDSEDHGIFCSALVAAAYIAAKSPEFIGLNPMKVTPRTLEEMGSFNDVTQEVSALRDQLQADLTQERGSARDLSSRLSSTVHENGVLQRKAEEAQRMLSEAQNKVAKRSTKQKPVAQKYT